MTDAHIARLLADLIHIFTRMETKMALNFAAIEASLTDLNAKVAGVSAAVAALPASAPVSGLDEAAVQSTIDGYQAQIAALTAQLQADIDALNAKTAPPAPAPAA